MEYNRVYPRTRGETCRWSKNGRSIQGLSPHARGNLRSRPPRCTDRGSIPARAGKPHYIFPCSNPERVYPRTRGETSKRDTLSLIAQGLSPHARGNQYVGGLSIIALGSIPARAGKPIAPPFTARPHRVYPRTRGETRSSIGRGKARMGLSPHARGNLKGRGRHSINSGSIPARAGKPSPTDVPIDDNGVYPRTRGETPNCRSAIARYRGLSPHARGNHRIRATNLPVAGSIPARAGKPLRPLSVSTWGRVYPRTRGETAKPALPFQEG